MILEMTVSEEFLQPIEKCISITKNEVEAFVAEAVAIVTRKIEEIGERR